MCFGSCFVFVALGDDGDCFGAPGDCFSDDRSRGKPRLLLRLKNTSPGAPKPAPGPPKPTKHNEKTKQKTIFRSNPGKGRALGNLQQYGCQGVKLVLKPLNQQHNSFWPGF